MKIGIDCGHCLKGADTGAQGNGYREEILTREIGKKVIEKLRRNKIEVIDCSVDGAESLNTSLKYRYTKANIEKVDLFVSIHLNAYNKKAYGAEILTNNADKNPEALKILKNLEVLGYFNRGIKNGSRLAVIRNTNMPAILIECCFIDNAKDMQRFNSDKISDAIVKGLIGEIKEDKPKVNYCFEFQKWYNAVTQTKSPILTDGIYGSTTQKAFELIQKLIKGEY